MKHILKQVCFCWNECRHKEESFFLLSAISFVVCWTSAPSATEKDYKTRHAAFHSPSLFRLMIYVRCKGLLLLMLASGWEKAQRERKYVSRLGARHDTTMIRDFRVAAASAAAVLLPIEVIEPPKRTIIWKRWKGTHPPIVWRTPLYPLYVMLNSIYIHNGLLSLWLCKENLFISNFKLVITLCGSKFFGNWIMRDEHQMEAFCRVIFFSSVRDDFIID